MRSVLDSLTAEHIEMVQALFNGFRGNAQFGSVNAQAIDLATTWRESNQKTVMDRIDQTDGALGRLTELLDMVASRVSELEKDCTHFVSGQELLEAENERSALIEKVNALANSLKVAQSDIKDLRELNDIADDVFNGQF